MAKITLARSGRVLEVSPGSNLMKALLQADVPVASSCSGDGVCAKCKLQIKSGMEHLTPENETEVFLKSSKGLAKDQRISCQTEVLGDVTIDASYW